MNLYYLPTLIGGIFSFCLGLFVFLKNKNSILNRSFFAFTLFVSLWLFAYTICYLTKNVTIATISSRIACTAVTMLAPTSYQFTVNLIGKKNEKKYVYITYFTSFIMTILFLTTNIFLSGVNKYFWGYYSKAGILHPLFLAFFFGIFIREFFLLLFTLFRDREISIIRRQQTKLTLLAFIMPIFGSIDFIPKYGVEFYPFGFIFVLIFCFIITYSIVKHRFLDIRLAITRTSIFVFVYTTVLGLPIFLATKLREVLIRILGFYWWVLPLGVMAILATIGPFVYVFLVRKAEDVLLAEQRRYQRTLRELSKTMVRIRDLEHLVKAVLLTVVNTVKVSH
ncbi:MAG: hypothetical protein N2606_01140, partial [Candidatus Omnitrophica bacterium]|nr:hypothetical protein [Candidatus Omnitrophota bacterium]